MVTVGLSACAPEGSDGKLADADFTLFQTQTYDVLLRDCGFVECHGREGRFLRVVGPGRTRLYVIDNGGDPDFDFAAADEELLAAELMATFRSAIAVIDARHPERSDLLRKPLSIAAGGAGHKGTDSYGRDVFETTDDPSYQALQAFAESAGKQ